jgi:hypothetical protein
MKRVVVATGLHESDIRPPTLMSEFTRLSFIDASNSFKDAADLVEIDCPACGNSEKRGAFRKNQFMYCQCPECLSLYVSPRPSQEALEVYYRTSEASRYRGEHLSRETATARRYHLLRSNANWLARINDEAGNSKAKTLVDIGTHSPLLFDELRGLGMFESLVSLNPLPGLSAECVASGAVVASEAPREVGVVTAFEKLESQFSPAAFLSSARDMLAEGGLVFFTTRTSSGFDIQMLWDKAPYLFVPEHLNLLSVEGIHALLERLGLELIELSTPGQLDLELTLHAARQDPSITLPSFVEYLLNRRDEMAHIDFQEFLQKHRLSSHLRVAARRSRAAAG